MLQGKKLFSEDVFSFFYTWQTTAILFVMCGLNLQQFIFIIQKCLTIQDTINPNFKLADNFTHTVSFSKQRISNYYQFYGVCYCSF